MSEKNIEAAKKLREISRQLKGEPSPAEFGCGMLIVGFFLLCKFAFWAGVIAGGLYLARGCL